MKAVALTAAGLALLTACGEPKVTPMNDEYAGNSGESVQSQEEESQKDSGSSGSSDDTVKNHADDPNSTKSDNKDTGNYADGTYKINGQNVLIPFIDKSTDNMMIEMLKQKERPEYYEDMLTLPFTSISKKHQTAFANAINGVVDGKPLKGLKIDKIAGASWTSEAFNKALEVARQEASVPSAS